MTREELQKVHDALSLLNSMVNCGEQHSPTSVNMTQAAFAILRKPLPPAEGAEEISAKQVFDRAYEFYRNMENKPAIPLEAMEMIFNSMIKFATLHAQRIAEKMVSERYEIAIKALETIHHAYYTEGESAEEQVVDLRSIALKALEEIDNLKTR